ncbi:MAG: 1-(5-phosphoribosyl)-5-((5-phosphoribosylamino)methylideneamino)imidazole-4-carboxamide isomerase [Candidatus Eisenbacteria bacterium]|nr:1-(5-phosphoribosyl)-5-((5-phosphoribosylamino)methylideneamino)imidazole-4-carboxamide isomerase [Candidatus Eisenbacteria bacterium]
MIAIPAVDLRDGACVQLVGGSYADERVRIADPLAAARAWMDLGFTRLHVVDLDAATGAGSNGEAIAAILYEADRRGVDVAVGGGVRDDEAIARLIAAGARHVVVGTRALIEPEWLARAAARFPDRLILAADVRGRKIATHGWAQTLDDDVVAVARRAATLPLAALLVTAVHREGRMEGPDLDLIRDVAAVSTAPVLASGGIASLDDLRALAGCGAAGAVIGMAFYTRALDPAAAREEFAT